MFQLVQTQVFSKWLRGLRDPIGRAHVQKRLDQLALGHFGDVKPVREGVSEMRIHYGPGYRVYFMRQHRAVIVLLAGGEKDSQLRDIRQAIEIARQIRSEK